MFKSFAERLRLASRNSSRGKPPLPARRLRARAQARRRSTRRSSSDRVDAEGGSRVGVSRRDVSTSRPTTKRSRGSSTTSCATAPSTATTGATSRCSIASTRSATRLEAAFLNAGIPCRLAQGRALSDDPVVAYVLAALRVISSPTRHVFRDAFFAALLPRPLFDEARAQADANRHDLRRQLNHMATRLPRADENGRQIRRALTRLDEPRRARASGTRRWDRSCRSSCRGASAYAIGARRPPRRDHRSGGTSRRRRARGAPAAARARRNGEIWIARHGRRGDRAQEHARAVGCHRSRRAATVRRTPNGSSTDATPSVGLAARRVQGGAVDRDGRIRRRVPDFTAIDLETTDNDIDEGRDRRDRRGARARRSDRRDVSVAREAARPDRAGSVGTRTALCAADVADAPRSRTSGRRFREFCGDDMIVAHNGYDFDFRILEADGPRARRALRSLHVRHAAARARPLSDEPQARRTWRAHFGIRPGQSHRALDDTRGAREVVARARRREARSRAQRRRSSTCSTTSASRSRCATKRRSAPRRRCSATSARAFAFGRYSTCLETYERERSTTTSLPDGRRRDRAARRRGV